MLTSLRILRGLLILLALLIAVIPPAVLVDLLTGGTGYGLCEEGLARCDTAYMTGPVLAARIFVGLLVVTVGIRLISRLVDRLERQRRWEEISAYYAPVERSSDRLG